MLITDDEINAIWDKYCMELRKCKFPKEIMAIYAGTRDQNFNALRNALRDTHVRLYGYKDEKKKE